VSKNLLKPIEQLMPEAYHCGDDPVVEMFLSIYRQSVVKEQL